MLTITITALGEIKTKAPVLVQIVKEVERAGERKRQRD